MALDKDFFRKVMGQFATGVTIATTRNQEVLAGLTVNSFTSVSLDPPLVLICVDKRSQALPFFRGSGVFAINILTSEQEALSAAFATPSQERYVHFCHAEHFFAATGAPILTNTLGFIDARIINEYPGGDHVIFIGQVEALGRDGQMYYMGDGHIEVAPSTDVVSLNQQNGHAQPESQPLPLLYYQGRYQHLSYDYHVSDSATEQVQHERIGEK